jgi:hypothetical protein
VLAIPPGPAAAGDRGVLNLKGSPAEELVGGHLKMLPSPIGRGQGGWGILPTPQGAELLAELFSRYFTSNSLIPIGLILPRWSSSSRGASWASSARLNR